MPKPIGWKFAALTAAAALAITGCSNDSADDAQTTEATTIQQTTPAATPEDGIVESDKKSTLADWEGAWEATSAYFDTPEVQAEIAEHAAEHGETEAEFREELEEGSGTEFDGIVVGDGTITFVANLEDLGSPSESAHEYTFSKAYDIVDGNSSFTWHIYEGAADAPYKYVALMPQHGEESLVHFHMRYGDDVDKLLNDDDWYPVMVKKDTADLDMIMEEIFEHAH